VLERLVLSRSYASIAGGMLSSFSPQDANQLSPLGEAGTLSLVEELHRRARCRDSLLPSAMAEVRGAYAATAVRTSDRCVPGAAAWLFVEHRARALHELDVAVTLASAVPPIHFFGTRW
jgi:hypothetical protein